METQQSATTVYGQSESSAGFLSFYGTSRSLGVVDYGRYCYGWPYPYPVPYPYPIPGLVHRACSCPNCDGSCCSCDSCKIRRFEKRVADLEAGK